MCVCGHGRLDNHLRACAAGARRGARSVAAAEMEGRPKRSGVLCSRPAAGTIRTWSRLRARGAARQPLATLVPPRDTGSRQCGGVRYARFATRADRRAHARHRDVPGSAAAAGRSTCCGGRGKTYCDLRESQHVLPVFSAPEPSHDRLELKLTCAPPPLAGTGGGAGLRGRHSDSDACSCLIYLDLCDAVSYCTFVSFSNTFVTQMRSYQERVEAYQSLEWHCGEC